MATTHADIKSGNCVSKCTLHVFALNFSKNESLYERLLYEMADLEAVEECYCFLVDMWILFYNEHRNSGTQ